MASSEEIRGAAAGRDLPSEARDGEVDLEEELEALEASFRAIRQAVRTMLEEIKDVHSSGPRRTA